MIDAENWSRVLEQFQEKCEAVFRPELREDKRLERFCEKLNRSNIFEQRVTEYLKATKSRRLGWA
ncbi:hypothetical protein ACOJBM_25635 [Rhizobium beringeri]|uniref:hypothetical protein n=1 Tax=Rhizobium beringeri TaxID=3019934 RepID=UPI003B5902D3